jgi:hypothetical protein
MEEFMPNKPKPPKRVEPKKWEHYELWKRVQEALFALPGYFKTETSIEGILATDIFTLNTALGATIEEQVVKTLNSMRPVWDPEKHYQAYTFVRQAQTFPDVLLRKKTNGTEILLGIELKGWYLLAKEGMPNFRFLTNPDACNPWDLIVVVPWALSNLLAGSPTTFTPFIELARYAAEKRNHYWECERETKENRGVILATGVKPYPVKSDSIADKAASDKGSNFGRLARYGIMDDYIETMTQLRISGITVKEWLAFFRKNAREAPE